jgi:hypothetical protein
MRKKAVFLFSVLFLMLIISIGKAEEVKVKILGTEDPYSRYLGIMINQQLENNWWSMKKYTCNFIVSKDDIGKEFTCEVPKEETFSSAQVSISSASFFPWKINVTYPDGKEFTCEVDRNSRCPLPSVPSQPSITPSEKEKGKPQYSGLTVGSDIFIFKLEKKEKVTITLTMDENVDYDLCVAWDGTLPPKKFANVKINGCKPLKTEKGETESCTSEKELEPGTYYFRVNYEKGSGNYYIYSSVPVRLLSFAEKEADPCSQHRSCTECNRLLACGWCADDSTCRSSDITDVTKPSVGTCKNWIWYSAGCPTTTTSTTTTTTSTTTTLPSGLPCNHYTDCVSCTQQRQCNWCETTKECVDLLSAEMCNEVIYRQEDCSKPPTDRCKQYTDCTSCTIDPSCGWCADDSTCRSEKGSCKDWKWISEQCTKPTPQCKAYEYYDITQGRCICRDEACDSVCKNANRGGGKCGKDTTHQYQHEDECYCEKPAPKCSSNKDCCTPELAGFYVMCKDGVCDLCGPPYTYCYKCPSKPTTTTTTLPSEGSCDQDHCLDVQLDKGRVCIYDTSDKKWKWIPTYKMPIDMCCKDERCERLAQDGYINCGDKISYCDKTEWRCKCSDKPRPSPPQYSITNFYADTQEAIVNTQVTFHVYSNVPSTQTGYYLRIYDKSSFKLLTTCSNPSGCTFQLTSSTPGTICYLARVEDSNGNVASSTGTVCINWKAEQMRYKMAEIFPTFTLTLSTSTLKSVADIGESVTLVAYSNVDIGQTPYYITIYEDSNLIKKCISGKTCVVIRTFTSRTSKTYVAKIESLLGVRASSDPLVVSWI